MNGLNYDYESLTNAMYCLLKMQELEDTKDFGKIKNGYKSKRYTAPVYENTIDSTFYTDMATSTLGYTIWRIRNISENHDWFPDDLEGLLATYYNKGSHDLIDDTENIFDHFYHPIFDFFDQSGDMRLFDSGLFMHEALYAYYNGFYLVTDKETDSMIVDALDARSEEPRIILNKPENINGETIDFYYIGNNFYDIGGQLIKHDYNARFLEERMPGEALDAINDYYDNHYIVNVGNDYYEANGFEGWAGLAWSGSPSAGRIAVMGDYFSDVILHEYGHIFDYIIDQYEDEDGNIVNDYEIVYNNEGKRVYKGIWGVWDQLTVKWADKIFNSRQEAEIKAGYHWLELMGKHKEFYAEVFQLYFYSDETRAALPKEVRETLEEELERIAGIEMED